MPRAKKRAVQVARRFVRECRKLASECVEGTAPELIVGHFSLGGQHCAFGEALSRCVLSGDPWEAYAEIASLELDPKYPNPVHPVDQRSSTILIDANNCEKQRDRHAAVVFPLLMMADAAEETLRKMGLL